MADLKHRLARMERLLATQRAPFCPTCQGRVVVVFDDDPDNLWPYSADGHCPRCGKAPPDRMEIALQEFHPDLPGVFREVPFSIDP